MRYVPSLGLLLALSLAAAPARGVATTTPGVNLRWHDCYRDGGTANRTFACDTDFGFEELVCSFELAEQAIGVTGLGTIVLDVGAASTTLPAWWSFADGGCRSGALTANLSTLPPGSVDCLDWAEGHASGGIAAYNLGLLGPQSARIIAGSAVSSAFAATLDPGQEYVALMLRIHHANTVGTGSCGGCDLPVCIFLQAIRISFPPEVGQPSHDIFLDRGANGPGSQWVTWQSGYPINIQPHCASPEASCPYHYNSFDCVLATTGARGSTWGQVKLLYR